MSHLKIIKPNQSLNEVRPFLERVKFDSAEHAPEETQKRSAVVDLIEQLAQRDAQISNHQTELEEAFKRGEDNGRALAEDEIEENREASLELLRENLEGARQELAAALRQFETMSIALAHEALEKLIGEDAESKKLLKAAIKRQLVRIDAETILSISVSRSDFPDTREVAELEAEFAPQKEKLVVRDDLDEGACEIKLRLGTLDVGLGQQWKRVSALLDQLEAEQAGHDA